MPTLRLAPWLRVCPVVTAILIACSSSGGGNGNGSSGDGGGGTPGGNDGGSTDGGAQAQDDSGGSGSGDEGGTEPAYLRNDAIAGFAFTANYGSPYDSILAAPLNTTQSAIAPGFATTSAPGQIVASERYLLVANSADLYSALDISASLSVSSGLASVNAKTDFAKSTQIDSTNLTVLVDLSQTGPAQKIVSPTLTAQAAALGADQFYALYGDRYAAEIVTGAEMFCTVAISTYSQQDKTSLTASLGFSYGASSGSASFASSVTSAIANHQTQVTCKYLGYSPKTLVTNMDDLLQAANAFQQGAVGTLGDVTTSALYLLYTSYYGVPGYMGVPDGTAAKVAQQGQIASDYLLYNSLVSNDFSAYYGDPSYSSLPFFTDMKAYRDGLNQYLSAAILNSQNPGTPVPTAAADGLISNWVVSKAASSAANSTPQFEAYSLANGIVPKKIADYAIPLKYAYPDASGNATLNGTTFTPVLSVPWVATLSSTSPVDYPLYLINRAGTGGGLWLEYQWDTGTYYFNKVTDAKGAPDPTLIRSAIMSFGLNGNLSTQYVVVNKANGLVLTDMGGANGMTASHATVNNGSQLWNFYVDNGANNCATFVPWAADAGALATNCTSNGNYPNGQCGSGLYAMSSLAIANKTSGYWQVGQTGAGGAITSNGGGGCSHCNSGCGSVGCQYSACGGGPVPYDLFFLEGYDSGSSQAIYNFAGTGGGAVSYVVTDATATGKNLPPAASVSTADGGTTGPGEPVVVGANNGYANALWVFIPATNVDTTP